MDEPVPRLRYFKYRWQESRGEAHDEWGESWWFVEVASDGYPQRQLEVYDDGTVLKYDAQHVSDEWGMLGDQAVDASVEGLVAITRDEFEAQWTARLARNRTP